MPPALIEGLRGEVMPADDQPSAPQAIWGARVLPARNLRPHRIHVHTRELCGLLEQHIGLALDRIAAGVREHSDVALPEIHIDQQVRLALQAEVRVVPDRVVRIEVQVRQDLRHAAVPCRAGEKRGRRLDLPRGAWGDGLVSEADVPDAGFDDFWTPKVVEDSEDGSADDDHSYFTMA